jgi:hypothetical protein
MPQHTLLTDWLIPVEQPTPSTVNTQCQNGISARSSNTWLTAQLPKSTSSHDQSPEDESDADEAEASDTASLPCGPRAEIRPVSATSSVHHMDGRESETRQQEEIFWSKERDVVDAMNITFDQFRKQSKFPLLRIKRIVKSTPEVQVCFTPLH